VRWPRARLSFREGDALTSLLVTTDFDLAPVTASFEIGAY
jgi:hypothetical protein